MQWVLGLCVLSAGRLPQLARLHGLSLTPLWERTVEPQRDPPGIRERAFSRLPGGANALMSMQGQQGLQEGHLRVHSTGLMSAGGEGAGISWLHLPAGPAGEAGGAVRTRVLKGKGESGSNSGRGRGAFQGPTEPGAGPRGLASAGDLPRERRGRPRSEFRCQCGLDRGIRRGCGSGSPTLPSSPEAPGQDGEFSFTAGA